MVFVVFLVVVVRVFGILLVNILVRGPYLGFVCGCGFGFVGSPPIKCFSSNLIISSV
eukprot:UN02804